MNKNTIYKGPDYKRIFEDILDKKYPHKRKECETTLKKVCISGVDIIEINNRIFGKPDKETKMISQKHRSYCKPDILKILDYQKKRKLNNTELALHFNISRNSITKWKKSFLV